MNTKSIVTAIAAAATVAMGGAVLAQSSTPPQGDLRTSTPGAGCTATGNAMRAGNLGGNAQGGPCVLDQPRAAVVAPAPAVVAAPEPAPVIAAPVQQAAPPAQVMAAPAAPAPEPAAPVLQAKADRG